MNLINKIGFGRLKESLSKTRDKFFGSIQEAISGKAKVDERVLEEIENILISCDIGSKLALEVIDSARTKLIKSNQRDPETLLNFIKNELQEVLLDSKKTDIRNSQLEFKPWVILVVGINGAGKTTTIGKLTHYYSEQGRKVVIGSADTFRAAANEQLDIWAKRSSVDVISKSPGSDPSSVAFETITKAKSTNADIVLIDTAGRLHTKSNLMAELSKIEKVIKRIMPNAPDEVLAVIDGNTGQNAIQQINEFNKYVPISGLIISKLDGTAKGGAIFQIVSELKIPIKFIGIGERITDLIEFNPHDFVDSLFLSS